MASHATPPRRWERLAAGPVSPEAWVGAVRTRLLGRAVGVVWAGLLTLGFSSIAAWLILGAEGAQGIPWLRWILVLLGLGAVGLTLFAVAARLRRHPWPALGRLRAVYRELADDVESALEMSRVPRDGLPLGESFARCHRERVLGELREVPPEALVPLGGLRWLAKVSALFGVAVALVMVAVPEAPLRLAAQLGLRGGADRLPWVLDRPVARPLGVEVHAPRYTGIALRSVTPGRQPIELPEGSRVTALFEADRAVSSAYAALPGGLGSAAESLGDQILRVRFLAGQDGVLVLAVRDADGILRVGDGGARFRVLLDRPPGVDLKPANAVIRQERAEVVDLRWEAEDDYGVAAVRLVHQVDDGPEQATELYRGPRFAEGRRRRVAGGHRWDLATLRLGPGSRVRFHLEAEDNRSLPGEGGGPGRTASPEQEIRIEGSRAVRLDVLGGVRPLLDATLSALADRYERFLGEIPPERCAEALREIGRQRGQELALSSSFTVFVDRVRAVAVELPPLLGEVFEGPLLRLAKRLAAVTRADRARALPPPGPDCLGPVRATGSPVVETLEELALQLDALTGRATLEEMRDLVRRTQELRKEIHRLAEKLRERPDEATRRELATRTAELRRTIGRLQRLAGSLGDEVMEEHVNRYALREGQREQLLDRVGRPIEKGRGDPLASMDRMVSQLEEAVSQGLDRFRQVMPIPGEAARSQHAESLRSLSERQAGLQGEVGEAKDPRGLSGAQRALAEEARRLSRKEPGNSMEPPRPGARGGSAEPGPRTPPRAEAAEGVRSLGEAARRMEEAAARLGRGDKQAARRLGEEALVMLKHLQAQAERLGRLTTPADAAGDGLDGSGDVKVPAAGGALPRELRESIQEAGRTLWPAPYKHALRRYYERLLR